MPAEMPNEEPKPTEVSLEQWLSIHGTRTGTFTINGITYTDLNEVEWRRANDSWPSKTEK